MWELKNKKINSLRQFSLKILPSLIELTPNVYLRSSDEKKLTSEPIQVLIKILKIIGKIKKNDNFKLFV